MPRSGSPPACRSRVAPPPPRGRDGRHALLALGSCVLGFACTYYSKYDYYNSPQGGIDGSIGAGTAGGGAGAGVGEAGAGGAGGSGAGGSGTDGGRGGMGAAGAGAAGPAGSGGTADGGSAGNGAAGSQGGSGGGSGSGGGGGVGGQSDSGRGGQGGDDGGTLEDGRDGAGSMDAAVFDAATDGSIGTGDLWVSPTGSDANPGTQASPLLTLQKAVLLAAPGTTIWMTAGIHSYDARVVIRSPSVNTDIPVDTMVNPAVPGPAQDGNAARMIRIWAAPGERPLIDFKPQKDKAGATVSAVQQARGIMLWAHYWHIRGVDIKDAADNCIHIAGSHNIVEHVTIHGCGDTGLQITVPAPLETDDTLGADNEVLNCDSYENHDAITSGENADGFAAKERIGAGNRFRGCRAWSNADDGWDLSAANDPVIIESSWAFGAAPATSGVNGDGHGFKLGGESTTAAHKIYRSFSFHNKQNGFTASTNPDLITCEACGAWGNGGAAFDLVAHTGDVTFGTTIDQAIAIQRRPDGSLPPLQ